MSGSRPTYSIAHAKRTDNAKSKEEITPHAAATRTAKKPKSTFLSKPPKKVGRAPEKFRFLGPPAQPCHLNLKLALVTVEDHSSRPRRLFQGGGAPLLRSGGAFCTVDFPPKRGNPPAPKHLMAQVRSALPTKLGGAFLKVETLQVGMGIGRPRFPFFWESLRQRPSPSPSYASSLNRQCTFTPIT